MSAIWYVLMGFVLGQGAVFFAMYLGQLLKEDTDELH